MGFILSSNAIYIFTAWQLLWGNRISNKLWLSVRFYCLFRDLTSVNTTLSVVALACWSVLIFSSSSLTTSLMASRWRWTFSNSSSCSLFSCSSIQVSSSWRIWWRALNSPLRRACSSALTLCSTEDWSSIKTQVKSGGHCKIDCDSYREPQFVRNWLG